MKNKIGQLFFVVFFCAFLLIGYSKETNHLPHFRVACTDNSYFDEGNLKRNKPVFFIYFLPDCDDCRRFTKTLLDNIIYLKNIQIVMITNSTLSQVNQFEIDFKLKNYPNLIAGTEGYTIAFQRQFHIESFPFVAAFNNKGYLIKTFREYKAPASLVREIKHLYFINK